MTSRSEGLALDPASLVFLLLVLAALGGLAFAAVKAADALRRRMERREAERQGRVRKP